MSDPENDDIADTDDIQDEIVEESDASDNASATDSGLEVTEFTIKNESLGSRLDTHLAQRLPRISRSAVQRLIKSGDITVNDAKVKPSHSLASGDRIRITLPPPPAYELKAEYLPLDVIYEDEIMLVVNKPPRIVVHPARGHWGGTLINAVLYHCHKLSDIAPGRPGIVHRLDRDTTGVILFMKEDWSHTHVARQFEYRRTQKEYRAIVEGELQYDTGRIAFPLGRHPTQSNKMAVRMDGREASTEYKVLERFRGYTYIAALPKTGRTHQIRVHLSAIGHPVAADEMYSKNGLVYLSELAGAEEHSSDEKPLMDRQALHAYRLNIEYPGKKKRIEFKAELHDDMNGFLSALRRLRPLSS
jgi:23S rRNA pseudouridine1911/1915/1917 synthase